MTGIGELASGVTHLDEHPTAAAGRPLGAISTLHFLEGAITVQDAELDDFAFGGFDFKNDGVQLEVPGGDVDFPIDGILGTQLLGQYEWWFDYDGGRCWLRPSPAAA